MEKEQLDIEEIEQLLREAHSVAVKLMDLASMLLEHRIQVSGIMTDQGHDSWDADIDKDIQH